MKIEAEDIIAICVSQMEIMKAYSNPNSDDKKWLYGYNGACKDLIRWIRSQQSSEDEEKR